MQKDCFTLFQDIEFQNRKRIPRELMFSFTDFWFKFGIQYLQRGWSYPFQIFIPPLWRNYRVLVKFSELCPNQKGDRNIFKKIIEKGIYCWFFSLGFLFNFGIQYLQRERSYPFQIFTSPTWRNYRVLVKFSELYLDRKGHLDIFKKSLKRREMMVVIFSRTETNYCSNGSNLFSFS